MSPKTNKKFKKEAESNGKKMKQSDADETIKHVQKPQKPASNISKQQTAPINKNKTPSNTVLAALSKTSSKTAASNLDTNINETLNLMHKEALKASQNGNFDVFNFLG
jgi:hypothetical protein